MTGHSTSVSGAIGKPRPLYVLPSGGGLGYGLFVLDPASRQYLLEHLEEIPDALTRGSAWVTLWENMLEAHVAPAAFVDLVSRARAAGDGRAEPAAYSFLPGARVLAPPGRGDQRERRAPALEAMLRDGIGRASTSSQKSAWFNAYRDITLTPRRRRVARACVAA